MFQIERNILDGRTVLDDKTDVILITWICLHRTADREHFLLVYMSISWWPLTFRMQRVSERPYKYKKNKQCSAVDLLVCVLYCSLCKYIYFVEFYLVLLLVGVETRHVTRNVRISIPEIRHYNCCCLGSRPNLSSFQQISLKLSRNVIT